MALTVNADFDILDYVPGATLAVSMLIGFGAALHLGTELWVLWIVGFIIGLILYFPLFLVVATSLLAGAWAVAIGGAIVYLIEDYRWRRDQRRPRP